MHILLKSNFSIRLQLLPLLLALCLGINTRAQQAELVIQRGHSNAITSVSFSPDGAYILTGSFDRTAKLWNRAGQELLTFFGHDGIVNSVAFSPDGQCILTGSNDRTARLWNIYGQEIQQFSGHTDEVLSAVFSPDGKYILTGSKDQTAKLWDLSGREIRTFSGHTAEIRSVAFSPDGQYILTGSGDRTARLWDRSGRVIQIFSGHGQLVYSVAFSPDGEHILTGSSVARLWKLNGKEVREFKDIFTIESAAFSPDGEQVLLGSRSGVIKLLTLKGKEVLSVDNLGYTTTAALSADGQFILAHNGSYRVVLLDRNGQKLQQFESRVINNLAGAISSNGRYFAAGNYYKWDPVKLWDLQEGRSFALAGHTDQVNSVAFSPDQEHVLTCGKDNTARLWDFSGQQFQVFNEAFSTAFIAEGEQILTFGTDKTIKIWDLQGKLLQNFEADWMPDYRWGAPFFNNGRQVFMEEGGGKFKMCDLSGKTQQVFAAHQGRIRNMIFSPKGDRILTFGRDSTMKLWDLSGHELQQFPKLSHNLLEAAFSPDGQSVALGIWDGTIILWDLSSGQKRYELQLAYGPPREIGFSSEGKIIFTTYHDGTIKFWEAATGRLLATLYNFAAGLGWVISTPDGRFDGDEIGLKNLHYLVGLEPISLERLKERYFEPGLMAKLMGLRKEPLRTVSTLKQVELYPISRLQLKNNQLQIELTERSGGIGRVALYIGDKEVNPDINPARQTEITIDLNEYSDFFRMGSENLVGIKTWNEDDWLVSELQQLKYVPPVKQLKLGASTRLFALCIGTSNYSGERFDLSFADQDAAKMAALIRSAGQELLYSDPERVSVKLLNTALSTDRWPSKAHIRQALQDIAQVVEPDDVFILYLAGHGATNDRDGRDYFYYLTYELNSGNINDREIRSQYAISTAEFAAWLNAVPAQKQVLILDACSSGSFNQSFDELLAGREIPASQIRALDRLQSRTGLFILSGSTADQVSYEASPFGQGLLTYSLLQGIKNGEALREEQFIDVIQLFNHAKETVPDLARQIGGVQEPMILTPYGAESYDIGRATAQVRAGISLSEPKPIFSRVRLSNESTFDDNLGLEKIINEQLREFSKLGERAELIFSDVFDDQSAYRIVGSYRVQNGILSMKARVMREGKQVGTDFELQGKVTEPAAFGKQVIATAYDQLK